MQPVERQLQWESPRCGSHVARVCGKAMSGIKSHALPRDHDDKHTETRSLVTSSVETCDKQLRDDISQLLGSHEEKHREIRMLLPHQIELLESKLREETKGALKTFLDMHGRHQTTLYTCVSGWKPAEDLHRHHVKPRPVAGGGLPLWRPRPHGDREAALARCCDVLELHCGRERDAKVRASYHVQGRGLPDHVQSVRLVSVRELRRRFFGDPSLLLLRRCVAHSSHPQLGVAPEEHPALLANVPLNTRTCQERMTQFMLETFHVPATLVTIRAAKSLFASRRTTGIVMARETSRLAPRSSLESQGPPRAHDAAHVRMFNTRGEV